VSQKRIPTFEQALYEFSNFGRNVSREGGDQKMALFSGDTQFNRQTATAM